MARPVFVDTGAWVALLNKSDGYHKNAVSIHQALIKAGAQLITTELVFAEMGGSFSKASFHTIADDLRSAFLSISKNLVVSPSKELFDEGWKFFRRYNDKNWSLADCVSFLVMKKMKLKKVFTFDHHFEQAGFEIITAEFADAS